MINFGANLIINENIYDKLKTKEAKASVKKTVDEYKKFVEHPHIKARTENDTIELKRAKSPGGYALELEINSPELSEPYVTGVYTRKKEPDITPSELGYQTLLYLCYKTGEKQRFFENSFRYINRVLFDGKLHW